MTKQLKVGDKFSWGKAFPTFTVVAVSKLGKDLSFKNTSYNQGPTPVAGSQLVLISETYRFKDYSEDYFRVLLLGAKDNNDCLYQKHYKLLSAARKYYLTLKTKGKAE